jgi:hypothetical protein
MRNVGRAIVDAFGISESLTYKAKEFNEDYFKGALDAVQKDYEARKDSISKNIMDEEERNAALVELDEWYKTECDRIRGDEDKARKEHADREEKRQNSLWNKVKGIFGTAVEEMATVWLTKFITKIADSILGIGTSLVKTLSGAAESVAGAVGGISSGAASAMTGLWTGLGAAVGTFLGTLLSGGKMNVNDITYWLKLIKDNTQNMENMALHDHKDMLHEMMTTGWSISEKMDALREEIGGGIRWAVGEIRDGLGDVAGEIKALKLKSAQHGAVVSETGLVAVHGTPSRPEIIIPLPDLGRFVSAQRSDSRTTTREINIKNEVHIDGMFITDREYTRSRLMPEIIEALESNLLKSKIQQALGV